MVIKDCISKAVQILTASGVENPLLDARVLLGRVIDKTDVYVIVNSDNEVSDKDADTFFSYVKRRAEGEPIAYIINEKEFMSLPFYVNPSVLIPRPDTEHLAALAIDLVKKENYTRIADFCTGSGALAVSVSVNCPEVKVTGYDISPEALDVAVKNKKTHNAGNVDFKILDVINDLDKINDKYDMVISNPPYISRDEMQLLDKTVGEWEPHLALFGGEDGLDFYRVISSFADVFLKEDGVLAFEVGHTQAEDVALIMSRNFCDIKIKKDYGGINRVVWGRFLG
ncbi:MAG: peptide chain release factor N(5)-glutamine methyltransferase [Ruminococcaceae bacterium]|nr:peptide chain release factor N(5)-glutamine methyltransferase [Oscillospiraceae bacterium]